MIISKNLLRTALCLIVCFRLTTISAQTGTDCENYNPPHPDYAWNPVWNFSDLIQNKVTLSQPNWIAFGRFRGFLEYTPSGYDFSDKSVKYPIIIFFHGRASRGDGSANQLCRLFKDLGSDLATHKSIPGRVERETSLFTQVNSEGQTQRYIVVSPQFFQYDRVYPDPGTNNYPSADAVDSVIDYMIDVRFQDKIDLSRIYLAGYSNGANMIMEYVGSDVERARRIAAVMPVSLCSQLGHFSNAGISAANVANA